MSTMNEKPSTSPGSNPEKLSVMSLLATVAPVKPVSDAPISDWNPILGARPALPPNTAELLAAVLMSMMTWVMLPPAEELFVTRKPAGASRQISPQPPTDGVKTLSAPKLIASAVNGANARAARAIVQSAFFMRENSGKNGAVLDLYENVTFLLFRPCG